MSALAMRTADEAAGCLGALAAVMWFGAAGFLAFLAAGFLPIGAWALISLFFAFRLGSATPARADHLAAAVAGVASTLVAAAFVFGTPGQPVMIPVVLLCGLAATYSVLLLHHMRIPSPP